MRENISAFINSRRFIAVFAILTIMFGGLWMAHTQMNRIPDLWEHVYRVSGITNGDIVARPVTSVSDYHRIAADNYGGEVDWQWINLSDQHRDPFDAVCNVEPRCELQRVRDFGHHRSSYRDNQIRLYASYIHSCRATHRPCSNHSSS